MSSEVLSTSSVGDGRRDIASAQEVQLPLLDVSEMQWIKHVARGGMAKISLYKWDKPGFPSIYVAKKSLFTGSVSERYWTQLRSEMNILAQLEHENIVKTFGIVETDHDLGIVMEYLRFGSYKNFFETIWDQVCTSNWEKIMVPLKIRILDEIVDAMKYLHGIEPKKVLHLDLKSDNVLLEETLHAKICDFGLSRMSTLTILRNSRTVQLEGNASGTPGYIAPERLRNIKAKPTSKSDVYSFGILEWEILTDKIPYEEISDQAFRLLALHVAEEDLRPNENDVPVVYTTNLPELVDMMKRSWSKDPDDRPSFQDLHDELNSIKSRITQFQDQAKTSANKILRLWRTLREPASTSAGTAFSEPQSRYMGIDRSAHSSEETALKRHIASVPASTTVPKRPGPIHTQPTVLQVQPPRLDDHDEPPSEDYQIERQRLIHNYEVEKKFCSTTKILVIVAVIISVCVAGGVFIWIKTSGSANAYQDCPYLKPPLHGHVNCTKVTGNVNVKCTFTCDKGYLSMGPNEVTCTGGKWSERPPVCGPVCSELKPVAWGDFKCSNVYFVNSTCTCSCRDSHQIEGNSSLTCQLNKQWSHPEPTCICPACFIGDKCQYSISWKSVANALNQMQAFSVITVSYGEETFTCTASPTIHIIELQWTGRCTDVKTGNIAKCHDYDSPSGSALHAAAQLIRSQVQYPEPCDPQDMETGC